jgi:hypothetical protein
MKMNQDNDKAKTQYEIIRDSQWTWAIRRVGDKCAKVPAIQNREEAERLLERLNRGKGVAYTLQELIDELRQYPPDAIVEVASTDPNDREHYLLSSLRPIDLRDWDTGEITGLHDHKPNQPADVNIISLQSVPEKINPRCFVNRLERETTEQFVRRGGHVDEIYHSPEPSLWDE